MPERKCYLTDEDYEKIEEQIYLINGVRHLEIMCSSGEQKCQLKECDKEIYHDCDLTAVKNQLKIAIVNYLQCIN